MGEISSTWEASSRLVFLGLRTVIYPAPDLAASRSWFATLLDAEPYFDQPFYVGFNVGGYELGLDPQADLARGPITYWGVADADAALRELLAAGSSQHGPVTEVGSSIRVATVIEPGGALLGIIENPHFELQEPSRTGGGPGK